MGRAVSGVEKNQRLLLSKESVGLKHRGEGVGHQKDRHLNNPSVAKWLPTN